MALRVTCSIALLVTLVVCQVSLGRILGGKRNHHRRGARDVQEEPFANPDPSHYDDQVGGGHGGDSHEGHLYPHGSSDEYEAEGLPPPEDYLYRSNEMVDGEIWESPEDLGPMTDVEANRRLLQHLYENSFDRQSSPLSGGDKLSIGLSFFCSRFDEETHVLKSRVWQRHTWTDSRLQWNPSHFNGIREVRTGSWNIWTPDLTLYNSVETEQRNWVNAIVRSTGEVLYDPPISYTTVCRPDKGANTHRCQFQLGSWTYDSVALPLELDKQGYFTHEYNRDCPYVVSNVHASIASAKYECCDNEYQALNVTFTIQKNDYDF